MLKLNYFLADIFILSAEKQPIKFSWRKIECLHIKSDFSTYIMNQNHGVGLKYLKRLLVSLGLYVPLDIRFSSALENLTQSRGGYAHTSHRYIRSLSPEDAKTYVRDVYEMMVKLANKSRNISYYSIH